MIRVVIDTNAYVSALVFGGKLSAVIQLAASGAFEVVVSAEIKAELVDTLTARFGWSSDRVDQACLELWDTAWWVSWPEEARAARDPESHARAVVTCESQAG